MHVLIFTGGQAPLPRDTTFYFAHAPKVDYVIAADAGLDTLESYRHFYDGNYDFSPNFILGDMDSIKDSSLLQKYSNVKSEVYNCDKDFTDTELALQHAHSLFKNSPEEGMITLVGGDGGKTEHTLAIYDSFSFDYHADVWLTPTRVLCFVKQGHKIKFAGINTEQKISVLRTSKNFSSGYVESKGLEWEGEKFRKEGMPSISNRLNAKCYASREPCTLTAYEADFIVVLPIDSTVWHPVLA